MARIVFSRSLKLQNLIVPVAVGITATVCGLKCTTHRQNRCVKSNLCCVVYQSKGQLQAGSQTRQPKGQNRQARSSGSQWVITSQEQEGWQGCRDGSILEMIWQVCAGGCGGQVTVKWWGSKILARDTVQESKSATIKVLAVTLGEAKWSGRTN